jgi:O-antigen ligase
MLFHRKAIGKHVLAKLLLVFAAVLGTAYIFQRAEFLGGKIQAQFEMIEGQKSHWQLTRLGSLLSDWEQIRVHPFVGWGPDTKQRLGFVQEQTLKAQGNGLSNFTAEFGMLGLGLFLLSSWNGFKDVFDGRAGAATLALMIAILLLNDECFLNFPVFMALMFIRGPALLRPARDTVQARPLSPSEAHRPSQRIQFGSNRFVRPQQ